MQKTAKTFSIGHYNKSRQNGNANKASPGDYAVVNELYEGKPLPDAPKGVTPCVAASQSHNQTTCMLRKMAGTEHQILNHCPQSPAANLPLRWLPVFEGFLANHPQQVEGKHHVISGAGGEPEHFGKRHLGPSQTHGRRKSLGCLQFLPGI